MINVLSIFCSGSISQLHTEVWLAFMSGRCGCRRKNIPTWKEQSVILIWDNFVSNYQIPQILHGLFSLGWRSALPDYFLLSLLFTCSVQILWVFQESLTSPFSLYGWIFYLLSDWLIACLFAYVSSMQNIKKEHWTGCQQRQFSWIN